MSAERPGVSFQFSLTADPSEVDGTLRLALLSVEALHGPERVAVAACCAVTPGPDARVVIVRTDEPVGRDLATLFLGLARREFGHHAVTVQRVPSDRTSGQGVTP